MKEKVELVIFDVDGVLTSGKLYIDETGKELKKIDYHDIDAYFGIRRLGLITALITGESNKITGYFNDRFKPDYFYSGEKNKLSRIYEISALSGVNTKNMCYVGDGRHDIEPMKEVGLSICPSNAIDDVKDIADIILKSAGGDGAIVEVLSILAQEENE